LAKRRSWRSRLICGLAAASYGRFSFCCWFVIYLVTTFLNFVFKCHYLRTLEIWAL
jgi:hypothetical protein